jgi:acyl-CoA ligase (AMP-forming) (exosortase A-associated)
MLPPFLLNQLIEFSAERHPTREALRSGAVALDYAALEGQVTACAGGLLQLGLARGERVALYLDKRVEAVVGCFAAVAAGGVMVPINPLLKPPQVGHILRDCQVRVLITTAARAAVLEDELTRCHDLRQVVQVEDEAPLRFADLLNAAPGRPHRVIDADLAAILYTSGSTGKARGVMLTHRNLLAGAFSVASYLEHSHDDSILAALPLSFDAGFSQLTTSFAVGARVVLLNYLLPQDVIVALQDGAITGMTAVPPLWVQLANHTWPAGVGASLRYFATTGGRMPREVLLSLRKRLPGARPFLMYGLTEAFRSTFLPPEEVERRPDSIGRAIPNAEILVLREDGSACAPNEPGELVHRGALVGLGYWNNAEKTAERFRPLPPREGRVMDEIAVFSGDVVRADEEGFLYFIGRRDELIKSAGYRVSPTEVEEVLYAQAAVQEAAVFGVSHPQLGEAIVALVVMRPPFDFDERTLIHACREALPGFMVPARLMVSDTPLPRNANGKIDRGALARDFHALFEAA